MKKFAATFVVAISLAGCGGGDVYERSLPEPNDTNALMAIKNGVKPEDREAWQAIALSLSNPLATALSSQTVGDAIGNYKARATCMNDASAEQDALGQGPNDIGASDYDERNSAHIKAYNETVEAYNACLKMPV